jgi:hypothetical protein
VQHGQESGLILTPWTRAGLFENSLGVDQFESMIKLILITTQLNLWETQKKLAFFSSHFQVQNFFLHLKIESNKLHFTANTTLGEFFLRFFFFLTKKTSKVMSIFFLRTTITLFLLFKLCRSIISFSPQQSLNLPRSLA